MIAIIKNKITLILKKNIKQPMVKCEMKYSGVKTKFSGESAWKITNSQTSSLWEI